ncbi:FAD-dependent oxidoreductase [Amycolatopsis jiangsuensis]|uniref:2-polyprenyl-6-methoxyphenol hydroxylase-like FAD-dependent oxidoreductase n=1 Tax=Amycolatopsis jiangsuensis TaxID=1181879 RepID=A0A840INF8_9PSEU|nr:FAD-dependent monooxygenase [Amycolatopsis jiangsuensis]MBB4683423.1 2-polyprenyl-6-methoxyphenol hydroxylase-like FAD-dependent oxidoreductase [Amycolatopsis jiangsuensis]
MTSPAPSRAALGIVGAGPGGLTCARILQRHGIAVTVYDRDPGPSARDQGGTLDLHADNGQLALYAAGLLDESFALARPEGQEMRQFDLHGRLRRQHVPAADELFKPEIDRGTLRDLLLRSLAPGTVQWGRTLERVGGPADGPRQLHFTDGTTAETDLVIGADGAFSRVRQALSPAVPEYTGVGFLEAWFSDVEKRHPEIAEVVGRGPYVGRPILALPVPHTWEHSR